MADVIVAMDEVCGIGKDGGIPWKVPADLSHFKRTTNGCNLVVGRKTYDSLPPLIGRKLYVVTTRPEDIKPPAIGFSSVDEALIKAIDSGVMTLVIGGATIYYQVMTRLSHLIRDVHVSRIPNVYDCDTFWDESNLSNCQRIQSDEREGYTFERWRVVQCSGTTNPSLNIKNEEEYLRVIRRVLKEGERDDGGNGGTIAVFSDSMHFDLREGFPLLTTRRMFLRGIVEELLFFIRGDTDSKLLEEKGVNIWTGNTSREFLDSRGFADWREGMMGPLYGWQWRSFNAPYVPDTGRPLTDKGFDQLSRVISQVKEQAGGTTSRNGRRMLLTTYNPAQVEEGVLPPCHSIIVQFYVKNGFLDMSCYNRSQDLALGTPFNIASHAILLMLVAKLAGLHPRHLHVTLGVAHIYEPHVEQMWELVSRRPYDAPTLQINREIDTLEDVCALSYDDFELSGYESHPSIKMKMVA